MFLSQMCELIALHNKDRQRNYSEIGRFLEENVLEKCRLVSIYKTTETLRSVAGYWIPYCRSMCFFFLQRCSLRGVNVQLSRFTKALLSSFHKISPGDFTVFSSERVIS